MEYGFFYGTLMKDGINDINKKLNDIEFVGIGTVNGVIYEVINKPFPGFLLEQNKGLVFGEIYKVTENSLHWLDDFEGYNINDENNSLYIRKNVFIQYENGIVNNGFTYVINKNKFELGQIIKSGNWKEYLQSNSDINSRKFEWPESF